MVMVRSVVGARAEVAGLGIPRMKEAENQDRIECGDLNTTVAHRSFNTDDLRGRGEECHDLSGEEGKGRNLCEKERYGSFVLVLQVT